MKYCQHCGHFLQEEHIGLSWLCPNCGRHTYETPIMGLGVVFFDEDGRLLLGRRAHDPGTEKLDIPGGFLDPHETLEEGAMREIREELVMEPDVYGTVQYVSSYVDVYEYEGISHQVVNAVFVASLPHRDFPASEEATEYVWRLPHELRAEELASQAQYNLIQSAAQAYRTLHDK